MSLRSLWATGPVLPSPMGLPSKWVTPMHSCAVPRIIISRTESSSACGMGRISTGMNVLASSIALVATVPTSAFLNSGSTNAPLASTTATLAMAASVRQSFASKVRATSMCFCMASSVMKTAER